MQAVPYLLPTERDMCKLVPGRCWGTGLVPVFSVDTVNLTQDPSSCACLFSHSFGMAEKSTSISL